MEKDTANLLITMDKNQDKSTIFILSLVDHMLTKDLNSRLEKDIKIIENKRKAEKFIGNQIKQKIAALKEK